MGSTVPLAIAAHGDCRLHAPIPGHPERAERLDAAIAGAALEKAEALLVEVEPERARTAIGRVHASGYEERLRRHCLNGSGFFDSPDNPAAEGTYEAARAAVSCVLAAADAVVDGRARVVWCPVRPPGHHALNHRAMGFCFFNNVAVAAEELLARGLGPLAILDIDVHHGNGTQQHFWERNDAFFLSLHRYPGYPGGGGADEIGAGAGRGFTRNFPLGAGSDDGVYSEALTVGLEELSSALQPAAWLISAGFDAHEADPLGGMSVTSGGYGEMGRLISATSGTRPVIAVLEGGYNLEALRASVQNFLRGLTHTDTP
jgi:acetoin utilization deacetylase AcuC-like enzyme